LLQTLREQKLYANMKKCSFWTDDVTFLGYIITAESIRVDPNKVMAINTWPIPKLIHDVRSFHRLASFYNNYKM